MSDSKPNKQDKVKTKNEEAPEPVMVPKAEVAEHAQCEEQIAQLREQVEVLDGKYRRALADYQNFEHHMSEEQHRYAKLATQLFVEQMLSPYDHLQMAAKHVKDKGLDLVVSQFKQLFESQGLKEIEVLGKDFNAIDMEAIETREGEEGKVLEIVQPGFMLNGIVVRPARVVVGKKA